MEVGEVVDAVFTAEVDKVYQVGKSDGEHEVKGSKIVTGFEPPPRPGIVPFVALVVPLEISRAARKGISSDGTE